MKSKILFLLLGLILWLGRGSQAIGDDSVEYRGKEVYLSHGCAVCHGKIGEGDGINAKNFNPRPTNFHDTHDYRQGIDEASIRHSIKYGIKEEYSIMPAFKDIEETDLQELVNFLISLQKKEQTSKQE